MKYIYGLLILVFFIPVTGAQSVNGVVTYNRKTDWVKIMTDLPWMTQEDIDRAMLNWGNSDGGKGTDYNLHFNETSSYYTRKPIEESEGYYSWKSEAFGLIRNHKSQKKEDWIELLGKKYRIKDEIPSVKWKILNEIKEVAGYICMKAETIDTVKNQVIHAWFSDAIMLSSGPEGYSGLPGMILELNINDGNAIVTATKVDLTIADDKLPLPKKMKGKELNTTEFNKIVKKYVDESIEGKRNPYWRIRY